MSDNKKRIQYLRAKRRQGRRAYRKAREEKEYRSPAYRNRLNEKQTKYVNALATGIASTEKEAREIAGYKSSSVSNNEKVLQALEKKQQILRQQFVEDAEGARLVILDLMNNADNENVRLQAAKDILSRAGLDPTKDTDITNLRAIDVNSRLTNELLNRLSKVSEEKKVEGITIDNE